MQNYQKEQIEWISKRLENSNLEEFHGLKIVTGTNQKGKPVAAIWSGRQSKPYSYYFYGSEERRSEAIQEEKNRELKLNEYKENRRKERQSHGAPEFEVGDIFSESWGYEQTNVNYYQVTEKVSAHYAMVREIGQERIPGTGGSNGMSCQVRPVPNLFLSDKEPRRVKITTSVYSGKTYQKFKTRDWGSWADKIQDPENHSEYCSWYY